MTPNPKNIGAAPEEYPIRALVRSDAKQEIWSHMPQPGSEIRVRRAPKGDLYYCADGYIWYPASLDVLPDAVGVPEPQPKGPSLPEVTQPGEGVDLEAAREPLARHLYYMKRPDWDLHEWEDRPSPEYRKPYYGEADHIITIIRATLRRESK